MKREARIIDSGAADITLVELDAVSQCQRCSRGEGCGAAMLDSRQSGIQLWVASDADPSTLVNGQKVLLEIDEQGSGWLWAVFAAYGCPLVGLMLSTGLSTALGYSELIVAISAAAGLCGGIFAWRQLAPRIIARTCRGLCLQSARIVAMHPSY